MASFLNQRRDAAPVRMPSDFRAALGVGEIDEMRVMRSEKSYCGMFNLSSQRYSDRRLMPSCLAAAALLPLTWRSTRVI